MLVVSGLGVDLVEVNHFQRLLDRDDSTTLKGMFTEAELAALRPGVHRGEQLAGWFSAKEAVLKALGVGLAQGIALTDVEVGTNSLGAPTVTLTDRPMEIAKEAGIEKWLVSISHTESYATATAIALAKVS